VAPEVTASTASTGTVTASTESAPAELSPAPPPELPALPARDDGHARPRARELGREASHAAQSATHAAAEVPPAAPVTAPAPRPRLHVASVVRTPDRATGSPRSMSPPRVARDEAPPVRVPATPTLAPAEPPVRAGDATPEKPAPAGDDLFDGRK
jgi:hypothetical protein